jgi:hypothetical protein
MGYRRSRDQWKAQRDWQRFVDRNQATIDAAGLPMLVTSTIDHWIDFLMHGCLDHHPDPIRFDVDHLSTEQYQALLQLVESYFDSGYEYFSPNALKAADQAILASRFEKR